MINKTFNSDSTDGRALEVGRNGERPWLNIREFDLENTMFMLAPSDAPALALAILEAAGVEAKPSNDDPGTPGNLGRIAYQLMIHIEDAENIIAEARERAELEAEAVELFNANHGTNRTDWDHADRSVISSWVRVARRARELAKEATK